MIKIGRPPKTEDQKKLDRQIGKRFRMVREAMNKTQEEIAEHYCKSTQAVRDWETGRSSIPVNVLQNLSDSLGIDLDFLLCKYDSPDLQNKLDEWNNEVPRIQAELKLLDYSDYLGIEINEEDYDSRVKRINQSITYIFSERKENMKTRSDVTVVVGSAENRIIENFVTGEITIQAVSEEDVERGFQHLIQIGIIADQ